MKKVAFETSDMSEEMLLTSVDDESNDGNMLFSQRERYRLQHSNQRKTRLVTTLSLALVALSVTTALQSVRLWTLSREATTAAAAAAADRHAAVTVSSAHALAEAPANATQACGSNASEAIQRGCVFDYMNFSWQPPECYYPQLDANHTERMRSEYRAAEQGPLRWWADAELTRPLPDDAEVLKMYDQVWVERRYHYQHCMYSWDLLHYSYQHGLPLPDLMTRHHSAHCAHVMWDAILHDQGDKLLIEQATTWFTGCMWPNE